MSSLPHIFVDKINIKGEKILIPSPQARHLALSLRKQRGGQIMIMDGQGSLYQAEILKLTPTAGVARKVAQWKIPPPATSVTICPAIPKGAKMDLIVEKATELGVSTIVPLISHRAIPQVGSGIGERRTLRWRRIAIQALQQSRNPYLPSITPPLSFEEIIRRPPAKRSREMKLIIWEKEKNSRLKEILRGEKPATILALLGPEGGFEEEEVEKALGAGFRPCSLGSRILRAETAAIAFLSIIQYELGELG